MTHENRFRFFGSHDLRWLLNYELARTRPRGPSEGLPGPGCAALPLP